MSLANETKQRFVSFLTWQLDNEVLIKVSKRLLVQVLMFSATLHSAEVRQTADRICQNPTFVDLKVMHFKAPPHSGQHQLMLFSLHISPTH